MHKLIAIALVVTCSYTYPQETIQQPVDSIAKSELTCLAKNIYFESKSEKEEGKAAVGIVTMNRTRFPEKFGQTICSVVSQKIKRTCQFSWWCTKNPPIDQKQYDECMTVAIRLQNGAYAHWEEKYHSAIYFHLAKLHPMWTSHKRMIAQTGNHSFFAA